jgi:hypothetical protein
MASEDQNQMKSDTSPLQLSRSRCDYESVLTMVVLLYADVSELRHALMRA